MRIELRQNRIVIILTEAESNFLAHKAAQSGESDVCSYIKTKVLKALELKGFEDSAIVDLANNFNLAKIKHISSELRQRKTMPTGYLPGESESNSRDEEDLIDDLLEEELVTEEQDFSPTKADENIGDDLLSDLLDKDLLKGHKKPQSDEPKAPKSPKQGKKVDKKED